MPLEKIREVLRRAGDLGTVESIYFEGGEPFLYYSSLVEAVRETAAMGFRAGIVSNGFWATSDADAVALLRPFAGLLHDLSIGSDLYHWSEPLSGQAEHARRAAETLDILFGYMSVPQSEATNAVPAMGKLPTGESRVMYPGAGREGIGPARRRASVGQFHPLHKRELGRTRPRTRRPVRTRPHLLGNLAGDLFETRLAAICRDFDPTGHPIVEHDVAYADACHLCNSVRRALRGRFPGTLGPDQMYGVA
jgi:hypothetical protein